MSMPVTTGGAPGGPKCHRKRSDIVVYFSWARSTKNKPRSPFEEAFDLSIERIATYDLFVCFEKVQFPV